MGANKWAVASQKEREYRKSGPCMQAAQVLAEQHPLPLCTTGAKSHQACKSFLSPTTPRHCHTLPERQNQSRRSLNRMRGSHSNHGLLTSPRPPKQGHCQGQHRNSLRWRAEGLAYVRDKFSRALQQGTGPTKEPAKPEQAGSTGLSADCYINGTAPQQCHRNASWQSPLKNVPSVQELVTTVHTPSLPQSASAPGPEKPDAHARATLEPEASNVRPSNATMLASLRSA